MERYVNVVKTSERDSQGNKGPFRLELYEATEYYAGNMGSTHLYILAGDRAGAQKIMDTWLRRNHNSRDPSLNPSPRKTELVEIAVLNNDSHRHGRLVIAPSLDISRLMSEEDLGKPNQF